MPIALPVVWGVRVPWARFRPRPRPAVPDPAPVAPQVFWRVSRLPPPWRRSRVRLAVSFAQQQDAEDDQHGGSGPQLSHAGTDHPFVERFAREASPQARRHFEKVSEILNSLMRLGQLYQTAPGFWTLVVGPGQIEIPPNPAGGGLTGTFSSGSFGSP